jgi:hypothetical protein
VLTAIMTFIGFLTGGILVLALMTKATRRWRELSAIREANARDSAAITAARSALDADLASFKKNVIAYDDLVAENAILKRDLLNIDVNLHKLEIDRDMQREKQSQLDERSQELSRKYLMDVEKWAAQTINANNYAACKQRLQKAIDWCREIGFDVTAEREAQLLSDLKADFEKTVRAALEREEQARIKAQIREEQQRDRELQRELEAVAREKAAIQAALDRALADTRAAHSDEVALLQARLAEAEARNQRALSQAQLTRAGHIYVISNIGSLGDDVFKIGMTRRLDPRERVVELGDASVPFPFDVHMMITCDDAPKLENMLHKQFHDRRVNKVNPRKEFFKVSLGEIHSFVVKHHGDVNYVADAEALQYRQSASMSAEDEAYIEEVFEKAAQAVGVPDTED